MDKEKCRAFIYKRERNLIDNLLFSFQNQRKKKTTQYIITLLLLIFPTFKKRVNVFSEVLLLLTYITYVQITLYYIYYSYLVIF